jgi:hypothetical protein
MAVKVSTGNFGKSKSTGRTITKKITISKPSSGKRKSSSSSSSSKKSSSSSSSSKSDILQRTEQLQSQGLDRANASQIANAEAKGQTITNISTPVAQTIASKGIKSSAVSSTEVAKALPPPPKKDIFEIARDIRLQKESQVKAQSLDPRVQQAGVDVFDLKKAGEEKKEQIKKFEATKKGRELLKKQPVMQKNSKNIQKIQDLNKRITQIQTAQSELQRGSVKITNAFRILPFLKGDNYIQQAARYALSLPAQIAFILPQQALQAGEKQAIINAQKKIPETRELAKQAERIALKGTPSTIIQAFNPRNPEGLVNLLLLIAPVLKSKGASVVKSISKPKIVLPKGKVPVKVVKNNAGQYAAVLKSGKVIKIPKKYNKVLAAADKTGKPIRAKKTEIARLTKKQLKKPLSVKERNKLLESITKKEAKKIKSEVRKQVNSATKGKGLKVSEKNRLIQEIVKYKQKPTPKQAKVVQRLTEKFDVSGAVRQIDARILRGFKAKSKPKVKKVTRKRLTEKQKAKRFKEELLRKQRAVKKKQKIAQEKALKQAKKEGFKDVNEQILYQKLLRSARTGNKSSLKKLESLQKKIAKSKSAVAKKRAKQTQRVIDAIVKQAITKLKKGKIKISKRKVPTRKAKSIKKKIKDLEQKRIKTFVDLQRIETLKRQIQKTPKQQLEQAPKTAARQQTVTKSRTVRRIVKKKGLTTKQKQVVRKRLSSIKKAVRRSVVAVSQARKTNSLTANKVDSSIDRIDEQRKRIKDIIENVPAQDKKLNQDVTQLKDNIDKLKERYETIKKRIVRRVVRSKKRVRKQRKIKIKKRKPDQKKKRKITKKVIKKKKKRSFTSTIRGAARGKRATTAQRKRKRFTGIETRGR